MSVHLLENICTCDQLHPRFYPRESPGSWTWSVVRLCPFSRSLPKSSADPAAWSSPSSPFVSVHPSIWRHFVRSFFVYCTVSSTKCVKISQSTKYHDDKWFSMNGTKEISSCSTTPWSLIKWDWITRLVLSSLRYSRMRRSQLAILP